MPSLGEKHKILNVSLFYFKYSNLISLTNHGNDSRLLLLFFVVIALEKTDQFTQKSLILKKIPKTILWYLRRKMAKSSGEKRMYSWQPFSCSYPETQEQLSMHMTLILHICSKEKNQMYRSPNLKANSTWPSPDGYSISRAPPNHPHLGLTPASAIATWEDYSTRAVHFP